MCSSNIEINNFLINNEKVDDIQAKLNYFNPLEIIGVENSEIKNTKILAWLLNPNENHYLGDKFLTRFLSEAFKHVEDKWVLDALQDHQRSKIGKPINVCNIVKENLHNAIIKTEFSIQNVKIDILIELPEQKWVFIIENKLEATQQNNQLARYWEAIQTKEYYDEYNIAGIYLTIGGTDPNTDENFNPFEKGSTWIGSTKNKNFKNTEKKKIYYITNKGTDDLHEQKLPYVPLSHNAVANQLVSLQKLYESSISTKIYNFIGYYVDSIQKICDSNQRIDESIRLSKELCSENYKIIKEIKEYVDKINNINNNNMSGIDGSFITLYRENKDVIDFLINYGIDTPFEKAVKKIFEGTQQTHNIKLLESTTRSFGAHMIFLPTKWEEAFNAQTDNTIYKTPVKWSRAEKWGTAYNAYGYPMICRIKCNNEEYNDKQYDKKQLTTITLYAIVGPVQGRADLINNMLDKIEKLDQEFYWNQRDKANEESKSFTFIRTTKFKKEIENISNKEFDQQVSEFETAIRELLEQFNETAVKDLTSVIEDWANPQ